jgi:protein tyrosine/serine phosphatase
VGCKPRTQADFDGLCEQGVRTILNLETLHLHIEPERRLATKNGINFRNVPIIPSPFEPSERQVKQALLMMNDPSLHPIFVHCLVGEDRSSFIAALYRVYYQGWKPEVAWQAMLRSRFHTNFWLSGLKRYFWSHTQRPDWVRQQ